MLSTGMPLERNCAIHSGLRDHVFGIVLARPCSDEAFDAVYQLYKSADDEEEVFLTLGNMGCVLTLYLV